IDALRGDVINEGAGRRSTAAVWPQGKMAYTIDPSLPNPERVRAAMDEWTAKTPLTFVPRTHETDYVTFTKGTGCSSFVGKAGGQQFITLADDCSGGNAIHEIGHAFGLWHEQSRSDRDLYIKVHPENIQDDYKNNFQTWVEAHTDGVDLGAY